MSDTSKKPISEETAAEYIGISRSHLVNLRSSDKGPRYIRLGRRVFYREADIDAWLDQNIHDCGMAPAADETATAETPEVVEDLF